MKYNNYNSFLSSDTTSNNENNSNEIPNNEFDPNKIPNNEFDPNQSNGFNSDLIQKYVNKDRINLVNKITKVILFPILLFSFFFIAFIVFVIYEISKENGDYDIRINIISNEYSDANTEEYVLINTITERISFCEKEYSKIFSFKFVTHSSRINRPLDENELDEINNLYLEDCTGINAVKYFEVIKNGNTKCYNADYYSGFLYEN